MTQETAKIHIDDAIRKRMGLFLIAVGIIFILDRYLQTGWLTWMIIPVFGIGLMIESFRQHRYGLMVASSLVCGIGVGCLFVFSTLFSFDLVMRIGIGLLCFGLSWILLAGLSARFFAHMAWWALIPAAVFGSVGLVFLNGSLRIVDFCLYVGMALGLAFLAWGLAESYFGLIIPGCLLATMGVGIYLAWGVQTSANGLARTGVMLVCFSLGWGLITLFSRRVTARFVWWPLIPSGVLAMVGWGLYIGGNPANAPIFIGNTGSIVIILLGIYLLLMRRGIQQ